MKAPRDREILEQELFSAGVRPAEVEAGSGSVFFGRLSMG
jgi:hypothetical protein